ncbi:MAG TPA: flavoprotein [Streptosporangiaceae bacterium]|nr:flavoprotein [Streptosporangiaceae bacterium]
MSPGVLYVICCAAPQALRADALLARAQARGWETCLICTPTVARWLAAELPALANLTGHPVRSQYKMPAEPDVLPPPDAMLVAPATANTISKWALGISDNLALGLITEAIGLRLPIVALPSASEAQAAHPAFGRNVDLLRAAGVTFLPGRLAHPDVPSADADALAWDAALDELDRRAAARLV